jgi:glycosyltransferase involved in cell wall biosynthesis
LLDSSLIETKIVGQVLLRQDILDSYGKHTTLLGSVPRVQLGNLYRWADILVLPSLAEGSALVSYEALASGVPVIATPNAGTPVRNGIDGVIVPIRDAEALASAIDRFARDREFLLFCRSNAIKGRARLGLDAYRERLAQVVKDVVEGTVHHA